ncbi:hypothetical protein Poly21_40560 [Allorhodopirellula heiligendammensis]|uniref:Uncharacterized protein n=1 Tax=Allorhodopirellula heiligendammensis TaxID=2714739 RepID=A0A5C6C1Y8_9BACT|nr:hypothetical protein Poly21_40560 [Allorhodopirellula heiligendammensis]
MIIKTVRTLTRLAHELHLVLFRLPMVPEDFRNYGNSDRGQEDLAISRTNSLYF